MDICTWKRSHEKPFIAEPQQPGIFATQDMENLQTLADCIIEEFRNLESL